MFGDLLPIVDLVLHGAAGSDAQGRPRRPLPVRDGTSVPLLLSTAACAGVATGAMGYTQTHDTTIGTWKCSELKLYFRQSAGG